MVTAASEPRTLPLYEHAFGVLAGAGRLDYGETIGWDDFSEALGIVRDPDSWEFRGEWLNFRRLVEESRGLITTEAKMGDKGFRFLNREEMAEYVKNRENKKANDSIRKSLALSKVPRDGLSDDDRKRLDHWEMKTAFVGGVMKALLRKRNLPPCDPKEAVKKLR